MLILALFVATVGWNYVSAVHGGPKAKECLKVVDQNGKPVQGAKIRGGFVTGDGLDDYTPVDGITDARGRFTAQGRTIRQLSLQITKKGYYATSMTFEYKREDDGRWEPLEDACFNPVPNDLRLEDGFHLREKVRHANEK